MTKILNIVQNDLRIYFSQIGNVLGLILLPTVMTIVLGLFGGDSGGNVTLDILVVDHDQTEISAQFIDELEASNDLFNVLTSNLGDEEARQRLLNGNANALMIIEDGLAEAVNNNTAFAIQFYSTEPATAPSAIQQSVNALVVRWDASLMAERIGQTVAQATGIEVEQGAIREQAQAILVQDPVVFDYTLTQIDNADSTSGFQQSVPGMGAMFVLFTVLGGMSTLIRERKLWTMQRLVVMPVSASQIIAGKIITYFTLGFIQFCIVILIGVLFGMHFGNDILAFLLIVIAYTLAATALAIALSTRLRTEGQAGQLTTMLSLALAALGGAWWPLNIVPEFMRIIGHISPIAWAMDGFNDLMFFGGSLVDVLPEIGILLAIAGVLFVIGVRGFKYE